LSIEYLKLLFNFFHEFYSVYVFETLLLENSTFSIIKIYNNSIYEI